MQHDQIRPPRGPADPQRRERIITATVDVLLAHGMEGLTHRAVAHRAGVPLGSTTYYFATLDELRHAALQRVVGAYTGYMHAWATELGQPTAVELAEAMTELVCLAIDDFTEHVIVDHELSVASMRQPRLKELACLYSSTTVAVLETLTTPVKARALAAAMDGLSLLGLTSPEPLPRAYVETVFRAILTPDAPNGPDAPHADADTEAP
ncbi:TetR/AcrR family transcriptional regulator [Yinghuangia seranimata]|uniref:TetR/AcrR family transcriptional regulator n=1 Tax=Yinghuangia seranimata TaxID=408067 RepID=UPI00248D2D2E|nr:TetR family transcriptional regulator [Yinghuangia seranimata]MDI2126588.1 TetR family transcriptional regulator [Yinghuangia seranimata]